MSSGSEHSMETSSEEENDVESYSEDEEAEIENEEEEEEEDSDTEGSEEESDSDEEVGDLRSGGDDDDDDDESSDDSEDSDQVEPDTSISTKNKRKEKKTEKKVPLYESKPDWKKKLIERYEKLRGKSLYVRFPHALPVDKKILEKDVKALCSRIISVRRPRQKSTRFCLADFVSTEDRAKAMKELSNVQINGKKLFVQIPKSDSEEFLQQLIEKKAKTRDAKLAKHKLKEAAKKKKIEELKDSGKFQKPPKTYTSTLFLRNIPTGSTESDIRALFPKAVDIQIKHAKGFMDKLIATVNMPTPKDATIAKRKKYKMGESDLIVSFAIDKTSNQAKKNMKLKDENTNVHIKLESKDVMSIKRKPEESSKHAQVSPKKKMRGDDVEQQTSPKQKIHGENVVEESVVDKLSKKQNKKLKKNKNKLKGKYNGTGEIKQTESTFPQKMAKVKTNKSINFGQKDDTAATVKKGKQPVTKEFAKKKKNLPTITGKRNAPTIAPGKVLKKHKPGKPFKLKKNLNK